MLNKSVIPELSDDKLCKHINVLNFYSFILYINDHLLNLCLNDVLLEVLTHNMFYTFILTEDVFTVLRFHKPICGPFDSF